jgi:hypothetical protein
VRFIALLYLVSLFPVERTTLPPLCYKLFSMFIGSFSAYRAELLY